MIILCYGFVNPLNNKLEGAANLPNFIPNRAAVKIPGQLRPFGIASTPVFHIVLLDSIFIIVLYYISNRYRLPT